MANTDASDNQLLKRKSQARYAESKSIVYPLGMTDPLGLQSQASLALLAPLEFPEKQNPGIEASGRSHTSAGSQLSAQSDARKESTSETGAGAAFPRLTGESEINSQIAQHRSVSGRLQEYDAPRSSGFYPDPAALQKVKSIFRRRKFTNSNNSNRNPRRSTTSMDGDSSGGSVLGRSSSAGSLSVFELSKRDVRPGWKQSFSIYLESLQVTAFVTSATFLALFMDDFRLACLPTSLDNACQCISLAIMIVFASETIASCIVREQYTFRLFFWIDVVATFSMALDVPLIVNSLVNNPDGPGSGAGRPTLERGTPNGFITRLRSIVKVTRILRLMRLVQLYSRYQAARENAEFAHQSGLRPSMKKWWLPSKTSERSRVGQKLSDLTTQKVIVGILAILLIIPVFNVYSGLYGNYSGLTQGGLNMLHDQYLVEGASTAITDVSTVYGNSAVYVLLGRRTSRLVNLVIANQTYVNDLSGVRMRTAELSLFKVIQPACSSKDYASCFISISVFDVTWYSQFNAILNIVRTIFITFALGFAMIVFNKDAQRLVLRPIERMLRKVKDVSENPLAGRQASRIKVKVDGDPLMETRILESSLMKICSLLAVGFGDAGAEVISDNIKCGGDLNPMIPGHKVIAIFGFCDIRQFTDATEVLQEDVMEFVNGIAQIVHMEVSLHGGAPNKNIGDAFLLVWKLPKGFTAEDIPKPAHDPRHSKTHKHDSASAGTLGFGPIREPVNHLGFGPIREPMKQTTERRPSRVVNILAQADASTRPSLISTLPPEDRRSSFGIDEGNGRTAADEMVVKSMQPRRSILKTSLPPTRMGKPASNQVVPLAAGLHVGFGEDAEEVKNEWRIKIAEDESSPATVAPTADTLAALNQLTTGGLTKKQVPGSVRGDASQTSNPAESPEAKLREIQALADKALAAFIIIQAALKRSERLSIFSRREDLNQRMPNFQVRMGFGLHVGWAIEGAIGSEYKIDASYLSPNVNMASRLEAATKQFGTTILLSEDIVCMLSPFVRSRVRQIDCVTVKGSQRPMALFTYDVSLEQIEMPKPLDSSPPTPGNDHLDKSNVISFSKSSYENEFLQHPDLVSTWAVDEAFLERFAEGFSAYKSGNWLAARRIFEETRKARRTLAGQKVLDGPSCTLLDYMRSLNFQAPPTWPGYRELTEK